MPKLKSSDLILLILYSPGYTQEFCEPINGRTKITKMLFVFEQEYAKKFKLSDLVAVQEIKDIFKFEPWSYGPMSKQVLKDIEFLKSIDFVSSKPSNGDPLSDEEVHELVSYEGDEEMEEMEFKRYDSELFWLTALGKQFVVESGKYNSLSIEQKLILQEFKSQFNRARTIDILRYVYTNPRYKQYIAKSVIKDRIC